MLRVFLQPLRENHIYRHDILHADVHIRMENAPILSLQKNRKRCNM